MNIADEMVHPQKDGESVGKMDMPNTRRRKSEREREN